MDPCSFLGAVGRPHLDSSRDHSFIVISIGLLQARKRSAEFSALREMLYVKRLSLVSEEKGHEEPQGQQEGDGRACRGAQIVGHHEARHAAHQSAENGDQMILGQVPGDVSGGGAGED
jgi:hypothetical protein